MSIRKFIKENCPGAILPLLRFPSRAVKYPKHMLLAGKARNYLPYYQDELSREILSDRLKYIWTCDNNIFMDIAEKYGIKFCDPIGIDSKKYSGIVLLYDNEGSYFRYARRFLAACSWSDKYRLMTLKDFLNGAKVSESEVIALALTPKGRKKFDRVQNLKSDILSISLLESIRTDLQYLDVFEPVDDEIIIDAGSYDAATAIHFLEWGKGKVKKVYTFEFDPENAVKCEKNIKPYADKITLVKKGTWDRDEVMRVGTDGTGSSRVSNAGDTEVYLTTIDSVVQDERVTFIKMDVEGAELKSLMGARNTIIKNHPRLAICVYHKDSDLYEIPGYILSIVPEYKFYLRHYCSSGACETVLYAYCD